MRYEKIRYQWPNAGKKILIVIHRFSLVKAVMKALHICKLCNGVGKMPSISSFFKCPSGK
jgi:hypothetical protein